MAILKILMIITKELKLERCWHYPRKVRLKAFLAFVALLWLVVVTTDAQEVENLFDFTYLVMLACLM